jgi:hypothetical protein
MKGTILDFSIQTNEGIISADDNNRYNFSGADWKETKPPARGMRVDFGIAGSNAQAVYAEITKSAIETTQQNTAEVDFRGLTPYYQEEFRKIHESNESYKGKWNWAAFLFGAIWALTKGLWTSALTALIVTVVTGGLGGIVYWFVFGTRGNYIYYTNHVKKKQLFG